jgi:hypothetical protein
VAPINDELDNLTALPSIAVALRKRPIFVYESRHSENGPGAGRSRFRQLGPPNYTGGNVDDWHIGKGARMYYPVAIAGGYFSVGDPHAAQGDSELGGTTIETSLTGDFEFILHKRRDLASTALEGLSHPLLETDRQWSVYGFTFPNYLANELDRRVLRPNVWPSERPRLRALAEAYCPSADAHRGGGALPARGFLCALLHPHDDAALVCLLPGSDDRAARRAASDYLGFTILRQDHAPGGLRVRLEDDDWVDVTPVPHAFAVNFGELLSRWTNDRWKANIHRVVNPPRNLDRSARRLSIAFFTGPNHDAIIECLPTCRIADAPPKYPPIRAWDHFIDKVNASKVSGHY